MLKIFKYMKHSVLSIVCILLLLFIQAMSDLSLPDYTSDIVNVGIQQGGVSVNDKKVTDAAQSYTKDDCAGMVIKKGKKVFHKVQVQA